MEVEAHSCVAAGPGVPRVSAAARSGRGPDGLLSLCGYQPAGALTLHAQPPDCESLWLQCPLLQLTHAGLSSDVPPEGNGDALGLLTGGGPFGDNSW